MKKFFIGLILGAGLMLSMNASAEVVNYVGKTITGQFNVKLNGQQIDQPGLIIDGVSYLPTRTIAEMFGAEVKFDADMGIELTKKVDSTPTSPVITQPKPNPTFERYKEVVKELQTIGTAKIRLENEIHRIKTTHDTMNQDVSDLEQQLAEYEAQLEALTAEKSELERQLLGE